MVPVSHGHNGLIVGWWAATTQPASHTIPLLQGDHQDDDGGDDDHEDDDGGDDDHQDDNGEGRLWPSDDDDDDAKL